MCYPVCLWQCSVRAESVDAPWGAVGLGPCLVLRCYIFLPVVGAECHTGLLLWLGRHPKLYPTWWWPQHHWPKHVVDKLYTPDNIVVLWLLYPYRIITLDPIIFNLYTTWWWPQQHWPKHVVDKLYTPDNIVVLWLLYPYRIITLDPIIFSLYPTWWLPQQHWPKHVDKLYTPDNTVVLWLLYPYRIITLGSKS